MKVWADVEMIVILNVSSEKTHFDLWKCLYKFYYS
jgi:hypothetical protein